MKTSGTRYSPACEFQVVLEALKAEGKGSEAQVARAYRGAPGHIGQVEAFLSHGAEVFGGNTGDGLLEELEWVIAGRMNYYNHGRRHSRLDYRSPVEYLVSEGFIPKPLAEIGAKSGSAPGAQAHHGSGVIYGCDFGLDCNIMGLWWACSS